MEIYDKILSPGISCVLLYNTFKPDLESLPFWMQLKKKKFDTDNNKQILLQISYL